MAEMVIEPIEAFSDNYIWLLSRGRQAFVVDPGDADPVLARLKKDSLELLGILITHHHFDHVGGVEQLVEKTGCQVWGPNNSNMPFITRVVAEGDSVTVLQCQFSVMEIPGHTLDHIAYVGEGAVFCGDTLFAGGCGRVFEGTLPMMRQSLARLRDLPAETRVYCAHEYTLANFAFAQTVAPEDLAILSRVKECEQLRARGLPTVPTSIDKERLSNPFMRWDDPAIVEALVKHGRDIPAEEDSVFAELRQWKDTF
jgi:hydroxyacylglutathione hydrolase